ncbi:unnamed protein product [Rhizoctonia solani]|uniref:Peptidase C14 caspase domain-containing protein n=1 Tax=Rhizoctonia solani TaxID=456999 RepID=A0A8H3ATT5_9AGAM|nr:unnamed protein product [Rhizoctonia solani]
MNWPRPPGNEVDVPMTLRGARKDRLHILEFLRVVAPGFRAELIDNARRKDIRDRIEKLVDSCVSHLVAYFQGHGQEIGNHNNEDYSVRCTFIFVSIEAPLTQAPDITGDPNGDGQLESFTAEELIEMFSAFSARATLVAITDFCHSGNVYRMQFRLRVLNDGTGLWQETREWNDDSKLGQKNKIKAPMIHIAGSLRRQQVYETDKRGGYFTNSLAHLKDVSVTLPRFLLNLRELVNVHLTDAKAHATNPLDACAAQIPQIFSNRMWPLDDPGMLSRICLGTI